MMSSALFIVTGVLYLVAGVLFFVYLFRGASAIGVLGRSVLGLAAASHFAEIAVQANSQTGIVLTLEQTLALASLLLVALFLALGLKFRIEVLGAFITPIALLFYIAAGLARSVGPVSTEVRSALLPVHIVVNVLGVTAFALAFATAIGYVIQERLLRQKQLGGLFRRLPSLDVLDNFALRLVMFGFPMLTLGIITGAVWSARIHESGPVMSANQIFGLFAWGFFGSVLLLRIAAGWRGRRAAVGTMLGFVCTIVALLGYLIKQAPGAL